MDSVGVESELSDAQDVFLDEMLLAIDQFPRQLVIIIDDFDKVDSREVASLVEAMADTLPDHAHLVLSSRRKPGFAVSAMQARGLLRIIDQTELRFTTAEIAQQIGRDADESELASITERTEGWPIAVQLYRLWRERHIETGGLPQFNGQVSEVADYLTSQIFSVLPRACAELLFDISILEFAETELIDWMREREDSDVLLDQLEAELPMLVQHVDGVDVRILRIHPLLLGYAREELRREPKRLARLHRRAADWLWEHQRYVAAVRHLVATGDKGALLAQLNKMPFLPIFLAHGAGELRGILREVPVEVIVRLPRLQLMQALAHFKTGLFAQAEALLAGIYARGVSSDAMSYGDDAVFALEGKALELLFQIYVNGASRTADTLAIEVRKLAGDDTLIWTWCENIMCVVYQMRGDLALASQSLARTRELYRSSGALRFAESHLLGHEILIALAHGQLGVASELCGGGLRGGFLDVEHGHRSAIVRIAGAVIDYERNYHERSATTVRMALERLGDGEAWFDQYALAAALLCDVGWRQHGAQGVVDCISDFRVRTEARGLRCIAPYLDALQAVYLNRSGTASFTVKAGDEAAMWRTVEMFTRARIAEDISRRSFRSALARAEGLIRDGRERLRQMTEIRGLILAAVANDGLGKIKDADIAMRKAVRLAQAEQVVACFLEEGEAAKTILARLDVTALTPVESHHVDAIRRTMDRRPQFAAPNALNGKEAEIMAHLAQGASNKLIGRRMGLSDNTVKFHLKKIYAKLGVSSRRAAVARALDSDQPVTQ